MSLGKSAVDYSQRLVAAQGAAQDAEAPWPQEEVRTLHADACAHAQRMDVFLCAAVPEFSRSHLQQRIAAGDVLRNGTPCTKAATRLRAGDCLQITLRQSEQSQAFVPQAMPLDVLWQDAHLRIIHKPAGLVVHPAPGNWSGTLLNGLLAHDAQAALLPRAGIVHRLDKDTSGLMVVARTRACMDALVAAIAARSVQREYLALAHARWAGQGVRCIEAAIGRDVRNRLRMAVVDMQRHSGKAARTDVLCLAQTAPDAPQRACWLHCRLHTGRTHQIRVHLAHIGHPLAGDALYGGAPLAGMQRQALHAWRLSLAHPFTGQQIQCTAPLPADLRGALAQLALDAVLPEQVQANLLLPSRSPP